MRRFEFVDSTSNKFWEVDVKGKTLNVTFGKIGTKGQSKPKDFVTPEKAKAEMGKLIKEKTGKGYVEVGGKAVKAFKPAVGKKTSAGSMGEGLSKAEKQAKLLEEDLGKGVKLEMVLVPAGKFMMGSPKKEVGRYGDETQHEVTLTKPFYMGKYEVTQEQWESVMGDNPSSRTKGAKYPVTDVSWEDCQEFIKNLNGITKGKYRLPTESEWEYACRAGITIAYSFGAKITPKDANYYDSKLGKPVEVGSYKPNAFGLYDMHGNVWEWCEDWKADYPKGAVIDPKGPAKGSGRVLRGGSFLNYVSEARSSYRFDLSPTNRYNGVGFRLARTAL
jgi:formylglycine-generating enzyme required for sulfatase activity